jgi:hypothetical protein
VSIAGQNFTIFQNGGAPPVVLIIGSGRVTAQNFKPVRGALVTFTNATTGEARTTQTNPFGYFRFADIQQGQAYNVTITHKRYKFSGTRTVSYSANGLIPIITADPEQ